MTPYTKWFNKCKIGFLAHLCITGDLNYANRIIKEFPDIFECDIKAINELFEQLIMHDKPKVIKWLYNCAQNKLIIDLFTIINIALHHNKLSIYKWAINIVVINEDILRDSYLVFCERGDMESLIWIRTFDQIDKFEEMHTDLFIRSCSHDNIEIVKYLSNDMNINSIHDGLLVACQYGTFNVLKYLIASFAIDIRLQEYRPFRTACEYGNHRVAKWLLATWPEIDVTARDNYAFRWSCINGHLKIAKWLLSISPNINIRANNDHAFVGALRNCACNVMDWLYLLDPWLIITMNHNIPEVYRNSECVWNYKISQWFAKRHPRYVIYHADDQSFELILLGAKRFNPRKCRCGHLAYFALECSFMCSICFNNQLLNRLPCNKCHRIHTREQVMSTKANSY